MSFRIDRRNLLGASLLLASSPTHSGNFLAWLATPEATQEVFSILKKYLGLKEESLTLMPDFLYRLKTPGLHSESFEVFQSLASDKAQHEQLAAYVLEEFVVASNYFAVQAGEETELKIFKKLEQNLV
jgi:hypothetical protein